MQQHCSPHADSHRTQQLRMENSLLKQLGEPQRCCTGCYMRVLKAGLGIPCCESPILVKGMAAVCRSIRGRLNRVISVCTGCSAEVRDCKCGRISHCQHDMCGPGLKALQRRKNRDSRRHQKITKNIKVQTVNTCD